MVNVPRRCQRDGDCLEIWIALQGGCSAGDDTGPEAARPAVVYFIKVGLVDAQVGIGNVDDVADKLAIYK